MKNCAFTIVAKNYVGLAQILERSIRQYYNDLDFYIIVADEVTSELRAELPANTLIAREVLGIETAVWEDMSFKYNLTEFCTSIKPASFRYFFDKHDYDKAIYLDPDICFFDSLGLIYDMLDKCEILLTPHLTQITSTPRSDAPENAWLSCGMFNLGFCGLRRGTASKKMIDWWHNRLVESCYIDLYSSLFTDQKWMDFIPSFFTPEQLHVSRHLGMNIAPWNFFERQVIENDGQFYVKYRFGVGENYPLIFVHYSGYDYRELKKGSVIQNNIVELTAYGDILPLTTAYAEAIHAQSDVFDRFITQIYSYNFFDNEDGVQVVHRRLYRSLKKHGEVIEQPFSTAKGSFHSLLKSKKMIITGAVNLDKATKKNLDGVDNKLRIFNKLSRLAFKTLGYERYMLLVRLLKPFGRYEVQIHLLDKKFDDRNIY